MPEDVPEPEDVAVTPPVPAGLIIRYFDEVRLTGSNSTYRLDYIRAKGAPPPPPAIRTLQLQVEDVERLVNILFQGNPDQCKGFFDELTVVAISGFIGDDYNIEIGFDNLQNVKNHIADAYPMIREPIWRANIHLLGICMAICVGTWLVYGYETNNFLLALNQKSEFWGGISIAVFLVPLGCLAGLFAEFLFRANDDIAYEQLRGVNPGRWKPIPRALNTIIIAFIFLGLLAEDYVQVGLGGTLLNNFKSGKPELSLGIGFITGFAFPYVRDILQQVRPERRSAAP